MPTYPSGGDSDGHRARIGAGDIRFAQTLEQPPCVVRRHSNSTLVRSGDSDQYDVK